MGIGIWIFYADDNMIISNTIEDMSWGVLGTAGAGNYIFDNNFLGNVTQAEDNGANAFDFFMLPGNLWDDYDEPAEGCFDSDLDRICDAAYVFTGNQDNRPQIGWPDMQLSVDEIYWSSYQDFLDGILSVDFVPESLGAVAPRNVDVWGTVNTNGVTDASTLPLSLGDIALGGSAPFTLLYNIPPGAAFFHTTVYMSAENYLGLVYNYPGPFPGP